MNQTLLSGGTEQKKPKGFAIASLSVGILAVIIQLFELFFWYESGAKYPGEPAAYFGIISASALGLIFGIIGLKSKGRSMAKAGIILCLLVSRQPNN